MHPILFVASYFVLTALFWLGNRNVGRKRPMASAAKWFIWTATWVSFSALMLDLKPDQMNFANILPSVGISPFIYPILLTKKLPILGMVTIWIAPWAAAAVGYILAVKHNEKLPAEKTKSIKA